MWYAILCTDREHSLDLRRQARPRHVARLQALQQQGRLLLAGPMPASDSADPGEEGYTGSLIVAEFDCLETARTWAKADPYVDAGVYIAVDVRPFKAVFPA